MQVVVDANVWLSAASASEPDHANSVGFLHAAMTMQVEFLLPALILPEVAGTVARRTRKPTDGLAFAEQLRRLPRARFLELTMARAQAAAGLAGKAFLRGADAQYAALAVEHHVALVTLDRELHGRSARSLTCLTPQEWVARFAPS